MKKKPIKRKPKPPVDEGLSDYTHLFNSFYDIFVGHHLDPKNFDLNYAVRDCRNLYATFVNLLDSNAVLMKQKHKFEKAPLEMDYKDYGIFPSSMLRDLGKNLDDIQEGKNARK